MFKVYSFPETQLNISHDSVGSTNFDGLGVDSVQVNMSGDRATNEVAADGGVMINKIIDRRGTIAITLQQTSPVHAFLMRLFNYLNSQVTPTSDFALTKVYINNPQLGDIINATGVAFQKLPDKPYQAQGQKITWNLLAADITQS